MKPQNTFETIYNIPKNKVKLKSNNKNCFTTEDCLNNLQLISKPAAEIIEIVDGKNHGIINTIKLFCNACAMSFGDSQEMRDHVWTRSHKIKSGWIDVNSEYSDSDEENEDSDSDEKYESDDPEDDEDIKLQSNKVVDSTETNLDILSKLKKISFHEACTFDTLYFSNDNREIIGIKRSLLFNKERKPNDHKELTKYIETIQNCRKVAIFMYSGGCFAGAIFQGSQLLVHKTVKRYTVRKKQGGSQTSHDARGGRGGAISAGAHLRRVQMDRLQTDIHRLVHRDWRQHVTESGLIFVCASKCQRHILSSGGSDLAFDVASDARVRHLSGRLQRVNSSNLATLFYQVSQIQILDTDVLTMLEIPSPADSDQDKVATVIVKEETKKKSKKQKKKEKRKREEKLNKKKEELSEISEEESKEEFHFKPIGELPQILLAPEESEDVVAHRKVLNLILSNADDDLNQFLIELLERKTASEVQVLINTPIQRKKQSFLHVAVRSSIPGLLPILLHHGIDPKHRNVDNETPFALAVRLGKTRACEAMVEYMQQNPEKFEYYAAEFSGAINPKEDEEREERQREKKRQNKKLRKQRQKQKAADDKEELEANSLMQKFLSLVDSEKMEFLQKVQEEQSKKILLCFQCGIDFTGAEPFTYSNFHFCNMKCLRVHKFSHM